MQQVVDELMPQVDFYILLLSYSKTNLIHIVQRLIGPALQAIREWITEPIVNTSFVESEMYDISGELVCSVSHSSMLSRLFKLNCSTLSEYNTLHRFVRME